MSIGVRQVIIVPPAVSTSVSVLVENKIAVAINSSDYLTPMYEYSCPLLFNHDWFQAICVNSFLGDPWEVPMSTCHR
jgi:hypothetical protein